MAVEHKIKIFDMLRNQRVHVEPIKRYTENCFFISGHQISQI